MIAAGGVVLIVFVLDAERFVSNSFYEYLIDMKNQDEPLSIGSINYNGYQNAHKIV